MPPELNDSQVELQTPALAPAPAPALAPENDNAAPAVAEKPATMAEKIEKMAATIGTDKPMEDALNESKAAPAPQDKPLDAENKAAPKPEDDLLPPEAMNQRSQERWQKLTGRVKEAETVKTEYESKYNEAVNQVDNVRKLVDSSNLDAQEFVDVLDLGRLVKSAQPEDLRGALQRLDNIRADVALRLGVDISSASPLDGFADLKQRVDDMTLTKEDALEIARLRHSHASTQRQQQAQTQSSQHMQSVNSAASQITTELDSLAATPGHAAKLAYIEKHFSSQVNQKALAANFSPDQWPHVVRTMYDSYVPPAAAAPAAPQPLRPTAVAAGQRTHTGPVTMQDSVANAMQQVFG